MSDHSSIESEVTPVPSGRVMAALTRLSVAFGVVAGWLVVPLVFVICYEVSARYLFNSATIWAYEVAYMLTGANFLLAIALVTYLGGHIRVDIFYNSLSTRGRLLVDLFTLSVIVVPFSLWVSWALGFYFLDAWKTNERTGQSAWNPPLWPFRLIYFVAFALLALQALVELLKRVMALRDIGKR